MSSRRAGKTTFRELNFFRECFTATGENRNLMRKKFLATLWIFPAFCMTSALAAPQIKNIKIAISNPSDHPRPVSDIVIPIVQIRKIAPDFTPGAMIVTASDASTLEQDGSVMQTEQLPSQVDDLEGD